MRFSTLTSIVLATAVSSVAGTNTYLKSSETDGEYVIGFETVGDVGNGVSMLFFDERNPSARLAAQAVHINNDTTLDIGDGGFGIYDSSYGPEGYNLTTFVIDFEHPDTRPPDAPGFSWAANGTLLWSEEKFHGWVHCQGGGFSGEDYSDFYWSLKPITTLPKGCKQVDLIKYEHSFPQVRVEGNF